MHDGVSRMFDASDKFSLAYDIFRALAPQMSQMPTDVASRIRKWINMPIWEPLFMNNNR
jgi:hypothetical protein